MDAWKSVTELADFRLVVRWPVQWGDQDPFGHVNNTIYFRWFETARIAYLERIQLTGREPDSGLGPILANISCQFRRPVTYPDWVQIGSRITRLGRSSFDMEHRLYSEQMAIVAADGTSTIVVFDYASQKPQPMSPELRQRIEALEARTF
ncbi:MAG TPA: thioesterase family protein [Pirellulales bacterium]|jgi:acyl-CoA thioester hydrolase|nr:thioesterase family protein [Pirellulales bacterium]